MTSIEPDEVESSDSQTQPSEKRGAHSKKSHTQKKAQALTAVSPRQGKSKGSAAKRRAAAAAAENNADVGRCVARAQGVQRGRARHGLRRFSRAPAQPCASLTGLTPPFYCRRRR